jgi:hypothetical protein
MWLTLQIWNTEILTNALSFVTAENQIEITAFKRSFTVLHESAASESCVNSRQCFDFYKCIRCSGNMFYLAVVK